MFLIEIIHLDCARGEDVEGVAPQLDLTLQKITEQMSPFPTQILFFFLPLAPGCTRCCRPRPRPPCRGCSSRWVWGRSPRRRGRRTRRGRRPSGRCSPRNWRGKKNVLIKDMGKLCLLIPYTVHLTRSMARQYQKKNSKKEAKAQRRHFSSNGKKLPILRKVFG